MVSSLALTLTSVRAAPAWWTDPTHGFISGTANDKALITQGQAKYIVYKAYQYLDTELLLVGGAGAELESVVNSPWFSSTAHNKKLLTLGQLKYLSKPFFEHLNLMGYDTTGFNPNETGGGKFPWTTYTQADDVNLALATIGQAKFCFSWDLAGWSIPLLPPPTTSAQQVTSVELAWTPSATVGIVGDTIALSASVLFSIALVDQVEFFVNGVSIGSPDTSAPFSENWSSSASGTYLISARADLVGGGYVYSPTYSYEVQADTGSNGLGDTWESLHNITSATDDSDGDGLLASDEYSGGNSPTLKDHPAVNLSLFNISL